MDANIERLLGGYATNTLTDSERHLLFEAALEDQELFNALQDEETLRDLLADVESRRAIQRALERPASQSSRRPWAMPLWGWGLAGSAVATAALIFAFLPSRSTHQAVEVAVAKPDAPVVERAATVEESKAPADTLREKAGQVVLGKSKRPAGDRVPKIVPEASRPAADQSAATPPPTVAALEPQSPIPQAQQLPPDAQAAQTAVAPGQSDLRSAVAGYMAPADVRLNFIPYSLMKRGSDGALVPVAQGGGAESGRLSAIDGAAAFCRISYHAGAERRRQLENYLSGGGRETARDRETGRCYSRFADPSERPSATETGLDSG